MRLFAALHSKNDSMSDLEEAIRIAQEALDTLSEHDRHWMAFADCITSFLIRR